MYEIAIVVLLLLALAMVALILVQQGKGAGIGASFGAGASNTVFGAVGSGNFLTRSTWTLSILFFAVCLFIGWLQKEESADSESFSNIAAPLTQTQEGDAANDADAEAAGEAEVPEVGDEAAAAPAVAGEGKAAQAAGAAGADAGGGRASGRRESRPGGGDVPVIGDDD